MREMGSNMPEDEVDLNGFLENDIPIPSFTMPTTNMTQYEPRETPDSRTCPTGRSSQGSKKKRLESDMHITEIVRDGMVSYTEQLKSIAKQPKEKRATETEF